MAYDILEGTWYTVGGNVDGLNMDYEPLGGAQQETML